jgi:V/A-type H+/Na+-transporting ATPase subunit I
LLDERKEWQERLEYLQAELARVERVRRVRSAGGEGAGRQRRVLKLYRASAKSAPPLPEGVAAQKMGVRKADAYWACSDASRSTGPGPKSRGLPEDISPGTATKPALHVGLAASENELKAAAGDRALLEGLLAASRGRSAHLQEVRAGMGAAESIAFVQGFVPVGDVDRIRAAAAARGWGLVVEDPGPQDDVPVKLKPPRWATPIKAVFQGIDILPAYHEADVSVVFMLFFSLFFAMIIGDAGYGAIFVGLTLPVPEEIADGRLPAAAGDEHGHHRLGPRHGHPIFGISPEILAKGGLRQDPDPVPDRSGASAQNIMGMCFLIGAVQITVGHLWNVVDLVKEKKLKALEQFGWILTTWFMFFLADDMVLGGNMASYLGISGRGLDALFWGRAGHARSPGSR